MTKSRLRIDDRDMELDGTTTILEAARAIGINIPTLCYHPALEPFGACRLCSVEIEKDGRKRIVTACNYPVIDGLIEEGLFRSIEQTYGFLPDDELRVIYRNSLGFIYPSLSEGFGLQGLEAIASGTILLASNVPVFREIYGSHAFYFNPKDAVSVSSTMFSVLSMKGEDKHKYLATAKEFIKKYSWEKMAKETLDIYRDESGGVHA